MTQSFIRGLEDESIADREDAIVEAVRRGDIVKPVYDRIEFVFNGHKLETVWATLPLRVGTPDDHVMISGSARLAERVQTLMHWSPITARLADILFVATPHSVKPTTQPSAKADRLRLGYSPSMSDVEAMIRQSRDVLDEITSCPPRVISNMGKHWVATKRKVAARVANYGWHSTGWGYQAQSPFVKKVYQPLAFAHSPNHGDYSQVIYGLKKECYLNGVEVTIDSLAQHEEFWHLVSSEGVMSGPLDTMPDSMDQASPKPIARTLREGMSGEDVKQLESYFGLFADGYFDSTVTLFVRRFQGANKLKVDGIVGPMTRAKMAQVGPQPIDEKTRAGISHQPQWETEDEFQMDDIKFVQAKNYKWTGGRQVDLVVLHSMEAPEKPTMAESVANWFAGKNGKAPGASAHFCIDNDSAVQGVRLADIAYAAPGANHNGIQIEHAGYARQTEAEWLDEYSEAMLWISARVTAHCCKLYNIPVKYIDRDGLKRGERGITTHNEVTFAWRKTTHRDPGAGFPMARYLAMVDEAMKL